MNIGLIILMIIGGAAGLFSTLYILIRLPYMIIKKMRLSRQQSHSIYSYRFIPQAARIWY